MTLNQLASKIAKREGKKHQSSIGDIREILKIMIEPEAEIDGSDVGEWERTSPVFWLGEESNKLMTKRRKKS